MPIPRQTARDCVARFANMRFYPKDDKHRLGLLVDDMERYPDDESHADRMVCALRERLDETPTTRQILLAAEATREPKPVQSVLGSRCESCSGVIGRDCECYDDMKTLPATYKSAKWRAGSEAA